MLAKVKQYNSVPSIPRMGQSNETKDTQAPKDTSKAKKRKPNKADIDKLYKQLVSKLGVKEPNSIDLKAFLAGSK